MNSWSKPKIGIIANRKNRNKLESYKYRENLYYTEKVPWLHFTYNFLVTLFLPNINPHKKFLGIIFAKPIVKREDNYHIIK